MAVSEGVRRLSLVLGLLVSVPWGLFFGTAFVTTTWSAKQSWDRAMSNWQSEQEKYVANVDSLKQVIEREKDRKDAPIESFGLSASERAQLELDLHFAVPQERPRDWEAPWGWMWCFIASPIVFAVPWGVVRTITWVVDGFRGGSA